ncbi:MAG TPA: efflux RND transporter periplasmic adaptor subunit [Paludibacter sp.]|nr:efflux RND transporter periplasmic adaptor subunit [Paludibacter sp.]
MKNICYLTISFLLLVLLFSCQKLENKPLSTYTVVSGNFEDILSIDGYVEPTQSASVVCPGNVDGKVIWIIEEGKYVEAGDTVCIIEDKNLLEDYTQNQVQLETTIAELNKSKADLQMQYALMEAQVKTNLAETEITNLDTLQLRYISPVQRKIKELELEKADIEKHKLEKKLNSLGKINQSELKKLELLIKRLTFNVEDSKRILDALTLTAPQSGITIRGIHYVTDKKVLVGDAVWSNMPLVIIPESKKMKVKINASEGSYKRINVNDSVEFTFDAIPDNKAWGKITMKSPVGKPVKENSKVKIFEIEASVDSSLALPEPGFTANCDIVLKRIADTIVIPQIAIFEQDSIKAVYVKNAKGYEMRQIMTGITSAKEAIVVTGLKRNEIISLSKPETEFVNLKTLLPDSIKKKYSGRKINSIAKR